jgi:hypothetical protein
MSIKEKIDGYLIKLGLSYRELAENTWIINDDEKGLENVVVIAEDPLVIIRVKVMDCPETNREEFYKMLLKLNAEDLIHGAYALEGTNVIVLDTLEGATMDVEEFQASLDAIGMALSQHYQVLSKYRKKG